MKIDIAKYKDKLYSCWVGKNIGGTMGTPYEGARQINDIQGFVTKPGEVLPNDDLDLQLVWMLAMEQLGVSAANAATLGEYWLSFITPHWNEYGIGKANMQRGLVPPLAGDYDNNWRNSNGAWIRTEIWASVAPGCPDLAARFAAEDAKVDHGAGEGTMAAAFVAAMQSAAYVVSDLRTCIAIGLAAIPEESRVAKTVQFVMECYDKGMGWKDTRNAVLELNMDIGDGWFEAPSNVGYTVLGLLYGEGDFKKSMIIAINCGDDTDCTGATVGSTYGILYGAAGIPDDWREYIGDDIVTVSIAKGCDGKLIPKTCTELAERVEKLVPIMVHPLNNVMSRTDPVCMPSYFHTVELAECEDIPEGIVDFLTLRAKVFSRTALEELRPYSMHFENAFVGVDISLTTPEITANGEVGVHIAANSTRYCENQPRGLSLRWILPEGFTTTGKQNLYVPPFDPHNNGKNAIDCTIKAGDTVAAENRIILEIKNQGRPSPLYASFVLLG